MCFFPVLVCGGLCEHCQPANPINLQELPIFSWSLRLILAKGAILYSACLVTLPQGVHLGLACRIVEVSRCVGVVFSLSWL
jgi:hypothetical protein